MGKSSWMSCRQSSAPIIHLFCFLRLPFGIKYAREMFQQKNCETFGDIPGVHIIADDMIITASSEWEHDKILQKVMERAKTAKVKFNSDKMTQVKYMGHVIMAAGQRTDDAKIKAIVDMPTPEDKQSLQHLLGMTTFLAQYVPNEAALTAPLRQLLKKDAAWQWCPHHTIVLRALKTGLTQAPVLRYYDHRKPLTLQATPQKLDREPACYKKADHCAMPHRQSQTQKEVCTNRKRAAHYSICNLKVPSVCLR